MESTRPLKFTALALSLFVLNACGGTADGNGSDGQGPVSEVDTLDACEEACSEVDACGAPESNSAYYCDRDCLDVLELAEELECSREFSVLTSCHASSNSCPVPDCLAETRAVEECELRAEQRERKRLEDFCNGICDRAATCGDNTDEISTCTSDCFSNLVPRTCRSELENLYQCLDPCVVDSLTTVCSSEIEDALSCESE